VLIFNQGNTVDRLGLLFGTLGDDYTGGIPVMGLTYDLGALLAGLDFSSNVIMHMQVTEADVTQASEPGSLILLGVGIWGVWLNRRKRARTLAGLIFPFWHGNRTGQLYDPVV
jgi:hypothetical protein